MAALTVDIANVWLVLLGAEWIEVNFCYASGLSKVSLLSGFLPLPFFNQLV